MYFISKNFWFTIHVDSWFWRIVDQICWACAILCSIPNLQARTDRRTDEQTDKFIRVGLGNLRFLQVNMKLMIIAKIRETCTCSSSPRTGKCSLSIKEFRGAARFFPPDHWERISNQVRLHSVDGRHSDDCKQRDIGPRLKSPPGYNFSLIFMFLLF